MKSWKVNLKIMPGKKEQKYSAAAITFTDKNHELKS
jgi:hypothetical protein